jgi:hypothetical protein
MNEQDEGIEQADAGDNTTKIVSKSEVQYYVQM